MEENINFSFYGDKTLSDKKRITALENAMTELIKRVEFCFDRIDEGVSESLINKIIHRTAEENNLGFTKKIQFTDKGFILTFSTGNKDYKNEFEVKKNKDGFITGINNLTSGREILVTYNNETEVT